jgi:hypothetical protein
MNPLAPRLAALRRRLRLVVSWRGACWLGALLLAAAVVTGLLDWRIHLPALVRAIALTGTLGGAGYLCHRLLIRPLAAPADDLSLALRVERLYPELDDALASAVEFLDQPSGSEQTGSPILRREAVRRALGLVGKVDFGTAVDTRGVRAAGLSFAGAAALALGLALLYPQLARTALLRLAYPFGSHDWPRQTRLDVQAAPRTARGEAYVIRATVSGVVPERAVIDYRWEGSPPVEQHYEIGKKEHEADGVLVAYLDGGRVQHPFRFQVRANDAASPWYAVDVVPPPQLVPLDGRPSPQVRLDYPAYIGLPAQRLPDGTTSIEAPAGSRVVLRAATDRPVARTWLEYPAELGRPMTTAAHLAALAVPPPAGALELAAAGAAAWQRIPALLTEGGRVFELEFLARTSGTFALRFEDELGIGNTRLVELRTLPDPAPVVQLERPSRSQDSLDVLPDAEVTLQVVAEDARYGLRSLWLEHRRKPSETGPPGPVERLALHDHAAQRGVAALLPSAGRVPLSRPAPPQRLEVGRRWPLAPLRLKEGEILLLQACADDYDDVTVSKQPGRSHEVELRVVSRTTLDLALSEAQAQVQQEIVRLQKQQQDALQKVLPAEKEWRENRGRLRPDRLDNLLQAEQLQAQIRARVGTKEEGLRAEVARVQRMLRDNRLPRSGADDRMGAVAAELDRLAREELEQIEPRLTEARKENEIRSGRQPAADPAKGPLSQARKHQEEVKATLEGLLKQLEPWTSTREVTGEATSLLQDQRKLGEQTEELAKKVPAGVPREELTNPALKAELQKAEEQQQRLGERTGRLLDKLDRLAGERQAQDPETAKALSEAAKRGKEQATAERMQEAAQSLRDNQLAKAANRQRASAQALEDVVGALQERREEDLDRLAKKIREAEDKLAELAERQERLRKKVQEAAGIADATRRQEALQRLAREQEEIQKEAQEMVRELSRLRSERAGQALSQATGRMEQAGRQLDRQEEAEESQEEALDRLNEARRELRQAREEVQEELARERLAKVAGQIKGLKDRQDSLTGESARIHQQVLQHKQWERRLRSSLTSLAEAQEGLAEETERLAKERLEGTKVFTHLLARSAEAMRQAVERMRGRLERAQERLDRAPADEDPGLDVPAEQTADQETRARQSTAARRMEQLLEALKPGGESGPRAAQSEDQGGGGQGGGGQGAGGQAGARDAIPPVAELKALRALQQEVNERTQAFGKRHAGARELGAKDREELQAIRQEQQEVADLLQQVTGPPEAGGDKK